MAEYRPIDSLFWPVDAVARNVENGLSPCPANDAMAFFATNSMAVEPNQADRQRADGFPGAARRQLLQTGETEFAGQRRKRRSTDHHVGTRQNQRQRPAGQRRRKPWLHLLQDVEFDRRRLIQRRRGAGDALLGQ